MGVPVGEAATDCAPFFGVLSGPPRCGVVRAVLVSGPLCGMSLSRCEVEYPGGDVALEELGRLSGPLLPGLCPAVDGGIAEVPLAGPLTGLPPELGEP
mmetsp:Transcript_39071/g.71800  ORF Transcript_39071/g.71800 Transcript_39071/m.71800 type:complete len:98 (+) Transcript_39071:1546-1839(+)